MADRAARFVPCPLCRGEDFTIAARRGGLWNFRVTNVICRACGFVFRNPPWGPEEAARFYRFASRYYKQVGDLDRLSGAIESSRAELPQRRVQWLQSYLPPGARVLDVGAGNGDFVAAAAAAGFSAEGIELDQEAVAYAQGRGLKVQLVGFEEGAWEPRSFAAVTMFDVLEHSANLHGFLRQAHRLVADEGTMLLEVPEAMTVHMRLEYYLVPEHNWHFTARALRYALAQEGWAVEAETILPTPDNAADALAVVARKQDAMTPDDYAAGPEEHDRVLAHFRRVRHERMPRSWAVRYALTKWLGPWAGPLLYRPTLATYLRLKKLLGLYRPPTGP